MSKDKFDNFEDLKVGDIIEYYESQRKITTKEIVMEYSSQIFGAGGYCTRIIESYHSYYKIGQSQNISRNHNFKIIGKVDMNVFNILFKDL